jgi:O-antigen/teichoic acid export membrane protein
MLQKLWERIRNSALAKNAAWLFAGQGLSVVTQGVYFIVLARLLGASQYGLLSGAIALVATVSQYSTLGSGLLFLRYVSADRKNFSLYWGNILLSVFSMSTLLVLGLWLLGGRLLGPGTLLVLLPLAVSDCMFQQFNSCTGQVFQTFEKMKISATLILLSNVLRLILACTFLFTLKTASAWQWALASLFVSFLGAVIAFVTVTRHFGRPSFSFPLLFKRAGEGFVFAISGSTTAVYNDVDKVVLTHDGMIRANGLYSMAYRVVNIGTMPIMSIVAAAFPRFFREGAKGIIGTVPMAKVLLKRTVFLALMISTGMFLLAPIIPHLVGKSYVESVSALRWLCLIPFFRCFHLSAGDAIAGAGYQKYRLLSQSIAALGNLGLNIILIPKLGWLGAAWTSLGTDALLGVMNWVALFHLAARAKQRLALAL